MDVFTEIDGVRYQLVPTTSRKRGRSPEPSSRNSDPRTRYPIPAYLSDELESLRRTNRSLETLLAQSQSIVTSQQVQIANLRADIERLSVTSSRSKTPPAPTLPAHLAIIATLREWTPETTRWREAYNSLVAPQHIVPLMTGLGKLKSIMPFDLGRISSISTLTLERSFRRDLDALDTSYPNCNRDLFGTTTNAIDLGYSLLAPTTEWLNDRLLPPLLERVRFSLAVQDVSRPTASSQEQPHIEAHQDNAIIVICTQSSLDLAGHPSNGRLVTGDDSAAIVEAWDGTQGWNIRGGPRREQAGDVDQSAAGVMMTMGLGWFTVAGRAIGYAMWPGDRVLMVYDSAQEWTPEDIDKVFKEAITMSLGTQVGEQWDRWTRESFRMLPDAPALLAPAASMLVLLALHTLASKPNARRPRLSSMIQDLDAYTANGEFPSQRVAMCYLQRIIDDVEARIVIWDEINKRT